MKIKPIKLTDSDSTDINVIHFKVGDDGMRRSLFSPLLTFNVNYGNNLKIQTIDFAKEECTFHWNSTNQASKRFYFS